MRVALLVSCLVDGLRPSVGAAALKLLRAAGCTVVVPRAQTCCGQPAWNSGDRATARALALRVLDQFAGVDAVVVPSGSCAGMVHQLPEVLGASHPRRAEAEALAARCYEITTFLVEQRDYHPGPLGQGQTLTYHDSCAGLRELGVKTAPRILLERAGYILVEMAQAETCCGFGGTFCVKYPEISVAMADEKLASAGQAGASLVVGGDVGCLLHLAGRSERSVAPLAFRHVLELLVPEREQPRALGQGTP